MVILLVSPSTSIMVFSSVSSTRNNLSCGLIFDIKNNKTFHSLQDQFISAFLANSFDKAIQFNSSFRIKIFLSNLFVISMKDLNEKREKFKLAQGFINKKQEKRYKKQGLTLRNLCLCGFWSIHKIYKYFKYNQLSIS